MCAFLRNHHGEDEDAGLVITVVVTPIPISDVLRANGNCRGNAKPWTKLLPLLLLPHQVPLRAQPLATTGNLLPSDKNANVVMRLVSAFPVL